MALPPEYPVRDVVAVIVALWPAVNPVTVKAPDEHVAETEPADTVQDHV